MLRLTKRYLALVAVTCLLIYGAMFAFVFLAYPSDRWDSLLTAPYLVAAIVLGYLVLAPFDKLYDEKFRRLEPISEKPSA